ncbi:hypothetical protein F2Q68_00020816 [Brassica cretica]|uniref:Uncharacterized protein n=1 Tax=Brassica cretica TaxID=69181 RepID=A0A8S9FP11_BRACR|nr:hypothetical protein F2Q68_00020816 [Brassica cretica]
MENDLASDREISVESDVVGAGEIEMKSPDTKQCIESFFDDHNMGFKHSEMRNCTGFLCSQRYEETWFWSRNATPQCLVNSIGQTHKFKVKVTPYNFTAKRQTITATRVSVLQYPHLLILQGYTGHPIAA